MYTMLRGATKRKAGLKCAFRRLTCVVSGIRSGSHIKIYVSATRALTTNCSVGAIRNFARAFQRFSRMVNFSCLHNVRVGSSGGSLTAHISHRSDVKGKIVKLAAFGVLVSSPQFSGVPLVLRAPSRSV